MWLIYIKATLSFILSEILTALFYPGACTTWGQEEFSFLLSWIFCNNKEIKRNRSIFFSLLCTSSHVRASCSLVVKQTLVSFQPGFRKVLGLKIWTIALHPWYPKHTCCACTSPPTASTGNYGVLCWSHKGVPAQGCWNPGGQTPEKSKVRTANLTMCLAPDTYLREYQAEGGTVFLFLCTCEIWQCQAPAPRHCSQMNLSVSCIQPWTAGWPVPIWKVRNWANNKAVLLSMNLDSPLWLQIQLLWQNPEH